MIETIVALTIQLNSKLSESKQLNVFAQVRAEQLCVTKQRSHDGFREIANMIPGSSWVGENLAWQHGSDQDAITGWLNSPTHKENIFKKEFRKVGAGYSFCNGQNIRVQMFADKVTELVNR